MLNVKLWKVFYITDLLFSLFFLFLFLNKDTKKAKTEESTVALEEAEDAVEKPDDKEVPSLPLGLTGDGLEQSLFSVVW